MAAIYLFKAPLERDVVAALHKLGPGYKVNWIVNLWLHICFTMTFLHHLYHLLQSQFNFDAETDVSLTTEEKKVCLFKITVYFVIFNYFADPV